jgi:hypothetical protein
MNALPDPARGDPMHDGIAQRAYRLRTHWRRSARFARPGGAFHACDARLSARPPSELW